MQYAANIVLLGLPAPLSISLHSMSYLNYKVSLILCLKYYVVTCDWISNMGKLNLKFFLVL